MKPINEYDVVDHGVDNPQYFQGSGTYGTDYKDIAIGCGESAAEALNDAMEQLAQNDWDVSSIDIELSDVSLIPIGADELYHYVSIKVK